MTASLSPVELEELEAEDLARARWYSFFSRWFLAPPDPECLGSLVAARRYPDVEPETGTDLERAWEAFAAAASGASLDAMAIAYDETFISVGEAPVSLHACVYLTGFSNERPLAEVRQWLAGHGIRSTQGGLLTEDHFGLLCEVMAWLIIDGRSRRDSRGEGHHDVEPGSGNGAQHHLFQHFIAPACEEFCRRLSEASGAGVYRELGRLFAAFTAVERQAFDIER